MSEMFSFLEIDQQVLVTTIRDQPVAVDLKYIKKIELVEEVFPIPRSPPYILGLAKIDGEAYPVISLQGESPEYNVLVALVQNDDVTFAIHLPELPKVIERKDVEVKEGHSLPENWIVGATLGWGAKNTPIVDPLKFWNELDTINLG